MNSGLALVVDDEPTNRFILKSLLKKNNFDVVEAVNGKQAIDVFLKKNPDIIFMDIMMPVMDGYLATEKIKSLSKEKFIPVIFLTAMADEKSLNKCIESGGDDFLTKPFNKIILMSKIQSMRRIQDLITQTATLKDMMQRDEEVAEKVFNTAITAANVQPDALRTILQPAGIFSGDMILTSYTPSHDLDILVGDFTGHGLSAAIGALPASEIFHAMSKKGFTGTQILERINEKLNLILPTGMFMAAQFVRIRHELDHLEVCNSGMPDILILDGEKRNIKHRIPSKTLPLGITTHFSTSTSFQYIPLKMGDRVILFSDGAIESRNNENQLFGQLQLESSLQSSSSKFAIDAGLSSIKSHSHECSQDDDISLIEAICSPRLLPSWIPENSKNKRHHDKDNYALDEINMHLKYSGKRLRVAYPIPAIINFIKSSPGFDNHYQALFTILTELFLNSLDHGILKLDSSLKLTALGFSEYFSQRDIRLSRLDDGYIHISITSISKPYGADIHIIITDSGAGFNHKDTKAPQDKPRQYCGRGINLVSELCSSLRYKGSGNTVEAIYELKH
ncbi:MAG: fused response regulator/phosphatase [Thiomicrorhabdus sp.]|nr:fused response regulator/phosphatase [Thiomicrorhabdus sp.]